MAINLSSLDATMATFSNVVLPEGQPLRREPYSPERERTKSFWDSFDATSVFYDVFRDHTGRHVYLIGPMALNLSPLVEAMTITGQPSGKTVRAKVHHGIQLLICRATLPRDDKTLELRLGDQLFTVAIQPNRSDALANDRIVVAINKDNELDWIRDWARFYVKEHGATAAVVYDNGSTRYDIAAIEACLSQVEGLEKFLVVPWPFRYGSRDLGFTEHRFKENWARFAQPPLFTQFFRKYAMHARSMVSVDIDELVVSPFRKSIFRTVEAAPFGLIRFNRLWVINSRAGEGVPHHADFVVRLRGGASKDRGKKWGLAPARAFFASWRAQMWTHQVRGWLNLAGSTADFYGYHFRGISHSWNYDRSERIDFDPALHLKDQLLIDTFADVFGAPKRR